MNLNNAVSNCVAFKGGFWGNGKKPSVTPIKVATANAVSFEEKKITPKQMFELSKLVEQGLSEEAYNKIIKFPESAVDIILAKDKKGNYMLPPKFLSKLLEKGSFAKMEHFPVKIILSETSNPDNQVVIRYSDGHPARGKVGTYIIDPAKIVVTTSTFCGYERVSFTENGEYVYIKEGSILNFHEYVNKKGETKDFEV